MINKTPKIIKARLMKAAEFNAVPKEIKPSKYTWWLEDRGQFSFTTKVVYQNGNIYDYGNMTDNENISVRPVLEISLSNGFNIGDRFNFGGKTFTIVFDTLALCDDFIGNTCFKRDWKLPDSNEYNKSDIKKFINDWFNNNK